MPRPLAGRPVGRSTAVLERQRSNATSSGGSCMYWLLVATPSADRVTCLLTCSDSVTEKQIERARERFQIHKRIWRLLLMWLRDATRRSHCARGLDQKFLSGLKRSTIRSIRGQRARNVVFMGQYGQLIGIHVLHAAPRWLQAKHHQSIYLSN